MRNNCLFFIKAVGINSEANLETSGACVVHNSVSIASQKTNQTGLRDSSRRGSSKKSRKDSSRVKNGGSGRSSRSVTAAFLTPPSGDGDDVSMASVMIERFDKEEGKSSRLESAFSSVKSVCSGKHPKIARIAKKSFMETRI